MKPTTVIIALMLTLPLSSTAFSDPSREDKQAKLDASCETVRQIKLTPIREQFVKDCVANEEQPSRKDCEVFYADYGNRMGGRAPLFYDLPECVTAFEYNQSSRSSD